MHKEKNNPRKNTEVENIEKVLVEFGLVNAEQVATKRAKRKAKK